MLDKLNKDTKVIVQGITGKEGQRVVEFMQAMDVKIVAGVRPGKAGEEVLGVPVYDTVKDVLKDFPDVLVSCVYVPPKFVLGAGTEAIEAGIKLLHVIGEGIPVLDTAKLISKVKKQKAKLLGPASLGLIVPGEFKLGQLMGVENTSVTSGSVGIVSRSGGMSSELANVLTQNGIGQSMVVHVGGDFLIGYTPAEVLGVFESDAKTKQVLMVGEVGGGYEREVVELKAGAVAAKTPKAADQRIRQVTGGDRSRLHPLSREEKGDRGNCHGFRGRCRGFRGSWYPSGT